MKALVRDELREIPGVGPSIAQDLRDLGIRRVRDLAGKDPERLYRRLEMLRRRDQDRCLLYVFRCAVYYASTPRPEPEKLKWWNWKDESRSGTTPPRSPRRPRRPSPAARL